MSCAVRLFRGQRGRAVLPGGGDHRRHQRAHRGRQLDGGPGGRHRATRHVPRLFRTHATRLRWKRRTYICHLSLIQRRNFTTIAHRLPYSRCLINQTVNILSVHIRRVNKYVFIQTSSMMSFRAIVFLVS